MATGCDSAAEAEEPSVPLAPPQEAPVMPVVQVRRYSWRSYDKHVAYDKRREFVGTNKQINTNSLLFSQQEPLVARIHLMKVVRKIGQQERSKGRHLTVDKFKERFSNGGKDVTSSSHPNRKIDEEKMTNNDFVQLGINKSSYKYLEIGNKYNSDSTGKQEREGKSEPRLPGTPDCKGMVTSLIDDVTIREHDGAVSLNRLVARQCKRIRNRLDSFTEQGCRKVIKSYRKVITIITFYCILVTQLLKGITSLRRYGRKSTVGNSERFSSSIGMRDYEGYAFYSVCEHLGDILRYKLLLLLFLIIHGLWGKYEVMRNQNKEIWKFMKTLTFRLVVAILGYVTYCFATFLETFGLRSGSIMETFMEGKRFEICLSPFSDLCASCHTQLRSLLINLKFEKKYKVNYVYIYLYIYRLCHCMLSCKWASFLLAFAVKIVYFGLFLFKSKSFDEKKS